MNKEKLKTGGMLLVRFAQIGCFTFGDGWSILAQIEQEFIRRRQLVTQEELLELTAMGRSLPGIMIANISMLFGCRLAGWFGGICAVGGITLPSILILSLVTAYNGPQKRDRDYEKDREYSKMKKSTEGGSIAWHGYSTVRNLRQN